MRRLSKPLKAGLTFPVSGAVWLTIFMIFSTQIASDLLPVLRWEIGFIAPQYQLIDLRVVRQQGEEIIEADVVTRHALQIGQHTAPVGIPLECSTLVGHLLQPLILLLTVVTAACLAGPPPFAGGAIPHLPCSRISHPDRRTDCAGRCAGGSSFVRDFAIPIPLSLGDVDGSSQWRGTSRPGVRRGTGRGGRLGSEISQIGVGKTQGSYARFRGGAGGEANMRVRTKHWAVAQSLVLLLLVAITPTCSARRLALRPLPNHLPLWPRNYGAMSR